MERCRQAQDCGADKLKIVLSVGMDGATVTQVAQRYDITRRCGLQRVRCFFLWTCRPRLVARLRAKPLQLRPWQTTSPLSYVWAMDAAYASTTPLMEPH